MKEFVYLIKPLRDNFIKTISAEENKIVEEHFQYLQELLHEHQLILAGPCLDGAFGIVIIQAESMEKAKTIMANDPAVSKGIMKGEIHPYRVSLIHR